MALRAVTISDFNAANFDAFLENAEEGPAVQTIPLPFGQVQQLLLTPDAPLWRESPDLAVVWTRPQAVVPSFGSLLSSEPVSPDMLLAEVDDFASRLVELSRRVPTVFVPTWTPPADERNLGVFDLRDPLGSSHQLMRMNLHLIDRMRDEAGVYVLDASRWIGRTGGGAYSPKLWYMGKMAFSNAVFREAALEIKGALRAIAGDARKLLVLDLDDTLWGGVLGDVGLEGLTLGGHDPIGEAFVDFQRYVKSLQRRGIVLGIVSKNDERRALKAIEEHPEMALRLDDFAAWRINWADKAQNVADLAAELNLGLQSTVFIDDNPAERARVREALPEVLVPEWPTDPSYYRGTLAQLRCFDAPSVSEEDRERTRMYRVNRERGAAKATVGSIDEWLSSLETTVLVQPLNETDLTRAVQLLNKTNQMNLSTRRMSQAEFLDWSTREGVRVWTARVTDRFGDQGLTGLLGVQRDGSRLRLVDFVLSCRVMGRRVEETLLAVATLHARDAGLDGLDVTYQPTEKNLPCLDFLLRSGLEENGGQGRFRWESSREYPVPGAIRLQLMKSEGPAGQSPGPSADAASRPTSPTTYGVVQ
jgi:FkbH-like protein